MEQVRRTGGGGSEGRWTARPNTGIKSELNSVTCRWTLMCGYFLTKNNSIGRHMIATITGNRWWHCRRHASHRGQRQQYHLHYEYLGNTGKSSASSASLAVSFRVLPVLKELTLMADDGVATWKTCRAFLAHSPVTRQEEAMKGLFYGWLTKWRRSQERKGGWHPWKSKLLSVVQRHALPLRSTKTGHAKVRDRCWACGGALWGE